MPLPTLGSFAVEVNSMLGNRTDVLTYSVFPTAANMLDTDRLAIWMKEAYNEICLGYRFEELEASINGVLVPGIDVYMLPPRTRMIRCLTMIFPSGQQEPREIKRRHIRNIRRYSTTNIQGPPTIYAPTNPNASASSIIVRPIPDQAYPIIWDVQLKPVFDTTHANQNVSFTNFVLPDDWVDIWKWAVALKGHVALVERDKAAEVRTQLYGALDTKSGMLIPGIIKQRIASRDQVDIESQEYGLQPRIRRYGNVP